MRLFFIAMFWFVIAPALAHKGCPDDELVPPAERFANLLAHLVRDKGKLDNDLLQEIAGAEAPFNPIYPDDPHFGHIDRNTFSTAFDKILKAGITAAEWQPVRALARELYEARTGKIAKREDRRRRPSGSRTRSNCHDPLYPAAPPSSSTPPSGPTALWSFNIVRVTKTSGVVTLDPKTMKPSFGQPVEATTDMTIGISTNTAAGTLRLPDGRTVALVQRQGWRKGSFTTDMDFIDTATGKRVFITDLKHQRESSARAYPFLRPDGTPAFVFQDSASGVFDMMTGKAWIFDANNAKPERVPRYASYHPSPTSQRLFSVAIAPKKFSLFTKQVRVIEIRDVGAGKTLLSAELGKDGSPSRAKTLLKEKPDGTLLVATRLGDRIHVFSTVDTQAFRLRLARRLQESVRGIHRGEKRLVLRRGVRRRIVGRHLARRRYSVQGRDPAARAQKLRANLRQGGQSDARQRRRRGRARARNKSTSSRAR